MLRQRIQRDSKNSNSQHTNNRVLIIIFALVFTFISFCFLFFCCLHMLAHVFVLLLQCFVVAAAATATAATAATVYVVENAFRMT